MLGAVVVACGSSSGGESEPTVITGTVGGAMAPTTGTAAHVGPLTDTFGSFTTNGVAVVVSHLEAVCSLETQGAGAPGATQLLIFVSSPGSVVPGSYPITKPSATANFSALEFQSYSLLRRGFGS